MDSLFLQILGWFQWISRAVLLVSIVLCLKGCADAIPVLDYNEHLNEAALKLCDSQKPEVEVNLCTLLSKTEWERVYIIRPYSLNAIESLHLENESAARNQLRAIEYNDQKSALLFVTNNNVEAIALVDGSPSLNDFSHDEVPTITENNCVAILKRKSFNNQSYYVFEQIK